MIDTRGSSAASTVCSAVITPLTVAVVLVVIFDQLLQHHNITNISNRCIPSGKEMQKVQNTSGHIIYLTA